MDPTSDLEFIDYTHASEKEVRDIRAILRELLNEHNVELPWEVPTNQKSSVSLREQEGPPEKEAESVVKEADHVDEVPQYPGEQQPPLLPPSALLPGVEAFVSLPPTTGSPYPTAPYFAVSRTLPYLRAYPPMGVPFFACPIPGTSETGPYGQFVPVVSAAAVGQEKFVGPVESSETTSSQKNSRASSERHLSKRGKKKSIASEHCTYEQEVSNSEAYREPLPREGSASPVSSADHGTSVPLVPLPVPSSFAATLPLHGYPPGLHTLPYTQMTPGPQSAAMYYVPVFNHPYGSYMPSPSGPPPMVLPVNIRPETPLRGVTSEAVELKSAPSPDSSSRLQSAGTLSCSDAILSDDVNTPPQTCDSPVTSSSTSTVCECTSDVQSNCGASSDQVDLNGEDVNLPQQQSLDAKKEEEEAVVTDCSTPPSDPASSKNSSASSDVQEERHSDTPLKKPWADLFKKPCSQVNGIDRQQHRRGNASHFKKDISNGKTYSVPVSEGFVNKR